MIPIPLLYDTTLRDGSQGENIDFSPLEKMKIAKRLDDFGIPYIEGGWPGANPRDQEFFELAKKVKFKRAKLVAFGATRKVGISCREDKNLASLLEAETPVVALFGKSWTLHVRRVLRTTLKENLAMIYDSVSYMKSHGKEVVYDAEHFFDGYKANSKYAITTLVEALRGGADYLVLCDTNGGTLPQEIYDIVTEVSRILTGIFGKSVKLRLGIHAHNDCNLAVANTIEAVRAGAIMVQGTINGFGERCGNADLTSIIPILKFKLGHSCVSAKNLVGLKGLSVFVNETANMVPVRSQPFVGDSAFAHKGGVHVSAVMKTAKSYEHMRPELVGNHQRVLVSDLSGKSNIEFKAGEFGVNLGQENVSAEVVREIKRLEKEGHQFDAAEASLKILLRKFAGQYRPLFELERFFVTIEKNQGEPSKVQATVKLKVRGKSENVVAEGDGPISALDNALRKALEQFYPGLEKVRLVDYKVRVINGHSGADSKVRVLITTGDQNDVWGTVGVSANIIEASWLALADSYHYKLDLGRNGKGGRKKT